MYLYVRFYPTLFYLFVLAPIQAQFAHTYTLGANQQYRWEMTCTEGEKDKDEHLRGNYEALLLRMDLALSCACVPANIITSHAK